MADWARTVVRRPLETRWPCPVCLGTTMGKVRLGETGKQLTLDHCTRCGGVWFEQGEAALLAQHRPDELFALVPPLAISVKPPCHGCGSPLDRDAAICAACGRKNTITCPTCDATMERSEHGALALDLCRKCRGVWFDNAELKAVWQLNLSVAMAKRSTRRREVTEVGGDVLLHSLFWAPDLVVEGAVGTAHLAGSAISTLGGASAEGAAHVAMGAAEVVGSAAEGVFTTILELIGSLFD